MTREAAKRMRIVRILSRTRASPSLQDSQAVVYTAGYTAGIAGNLPLGVRRLERQHGVVGYFDAVASPFLGAVQRLVGAVEHRVEIFRRA